MGWIKLLLISQVDININGNNRLILLFRSVMVKTVAFACVLKTPDRSIISSSGHRRANSSFLTSWLVSVHSCTTECPYTPPNTLSVRIHVISSQLSQWTGLGPHGDPHLRWLKFLLSMTWDLEEEVREEIAQHKEIKYGKRYDAWCGRLK